MMSAALLLVLVTIIALFAVLRRGQSTPITWGALGVAAGWGLIASLLHLFMADGGVKNGLLFVGYAAVWVASAVLISPPHQRVSIGGLLVLLVLIYLLEPALVLQLLTWGGVVAVPMAVAYFLQAADDHDLNDLSLIRESHPLTEGVQLTGYIDEETIIRDRPILEALQVGILLSDENGEIQYANQRASKLLGIALVDLLGQSIMTVLSRLPMIPRTADGLATSSPSRFELNGRQIEGELLIMNAPDQTLQGTVAILNDVSEVFQAEKAKSTFLNHISQELRTPLTAIKGYVEMLEGGTTQNLTPDQKDYLETIQRNVSRMVQQINNLIFVAAVKDQPLDAQQAVADLRQIVPQVVRQLQPDAARKNLKLTYKLDDSLRPIQADAQHVNTIFQELLGNAIKFTGSGGSIHTTVQFEKGTSIDQSFVVAAVEDNGIGITAENQKTIFDEFFQLQTPKEEGDGPLADRHAGGIGVGLAIVKALVEAYSGRIWLESEPGRGSKFTFIIPVRQPTGEQFALPVN